ncbi:hypothetical protein JCM10908_005134 [Rhodotorula pacifica]|uniref:Golgi transport complex subunit COG5 n=1 Tax=Rhodotorula pacifica TaxID=1495444 RepID=UPI0031782364
MPALTEPPAPSAAAPDPHADFLSSSFDPNAFAHRVLEHAATGDTTTGTESVSSALAKLNYNVQDLSLQLRHLVQSHHPALILQAASLTSLSSDLGEVRSGLGDVQSSVRRLNAKVKEPHDRLDKGLKVLERLRRTARLARGAQRFVVLARRLGTQMLEVQGQGLSEGGGGGERQERATAEAALTLAELDSLLNEGSPSSSSAAGGDPAQPNSNSHSNSNSAPDTDPDQQPPPAPTASLRSLEVIAAQLPAVEQARAFVVERMETSVQRALDTLDQPLLASSLQTAHNLSVLPALISNIVVVELCEKIVPDRVKEAWDMAGLARVVGMKDAPTNAAAAFVYKSRLRTEPTASTLPVWQQTFWHRLEEMVDELGAVCIKVYALEKVLKVKKDQVTQESFLDEALTVLDNKPSALFWTSLTRALEVQTRETARTSAFVQSTLSTSYPRLLRLFQEFFSKIAVHTDTVYTLAQQSPETILTLRAIQPFESLYLTRSRNRLNEAVQSAFSLAGSQAGVAEGGGGGGGAVPTANGGLMLARAVVNELDAARFDPLLAKAVAKGSARAIDAFVSRAEALVARDHAATSLLGPLATPSQLQNADLTSALYHLWVPLERALGDHIESVRELLRPSVDRTRSTYIGIVNPLILAIRREFSALLARMHRTNYAATEGGAESADNAPAAPGASAYMMDLTEKLLLVKEEILGAYRVGELARDWALDLARFIVQTFLLHASLLRVGESGKLRVTNDTTTLEFAVTQYLSAHGLALNSMGDQFKAVRAFRPLLFRDLSDLGDASQTGDVPTLILLHHILARGGLALPHQVRNWSETEYVRWLNEHQEDERIRLIEEVVEREKKQRAAKKEGEEEEEEGENSEKDETAKVALEIVAKVLARGHGSTAAGAVAGGR